MRFTYSSLYRAMVFSQIYVGKFVACIAAGLGLDQATIWRWKEQDPYRSTDSPL